MEHSKSTLENMQYNDESIKYIVTELEIGGRGLTYRFIPMHWHFIYSYSIRFYFRVHITMIILPTIVITVLCWITAA